MKDACYYDFINSNGFDCQKDGRMRGNMSLGKQMKNKALERSGSMMKAVSFYYFFSITILAQILVVWLSNKGSLFPGSDILMQIVGICAQIIAGLYGITLAGYTFFLSRIDALMASDTTLDYIVNSVKSRFKYLIWYITFNVLVTLFISILCIIC